MASPPPPQAAGGELLAERVRIGLWLIAGVVAVSALSDGMILRGRYPAVHVVQAAQLVLLVGLESIRSRRPQWSSAIALVGLVLICITTAATGIATHDDTTSPLLLIILVIAAGTLIPWDASQQAAVACAALLSIVGNIFAVSGDIDVPRRYPLLVAAMTAFVASVYIARRLQQARQVAAAADLARAESEHALRQAHDELERRVDERTGQLHRANEALMAEFAARRRVEEESRRHQAELAHATRLATMGQMAAEMAHELNQPLAAIVSYSQGAARRLRGGEAVSEEMLHAADEITAQALRAGKVLRYMTAFARNRTPSYATRDLGELIIEACRFLEIESERCGVTIELELAPTPIQVRMEPLQIEQVVVNLVRNGLDAMRDNGNRQPRLRVSTSVAAEWVEVCVEDNGSGLSAAAGRIFEPFYTTKPDGLGLGLSVSRSIVDAHGGRIWAADRNGPGASVHFTLPLGGPS